jgi:polyisoprenyl-teichoic acid--peptidoglycan teichoic acid transferase
MLSATAGALLAVSLSSTPLMQRKLSASEASIFNRSGIASQSSLKMPGLTRPVNILVLGAKVTTGDTNDVPDNLKNAKYQALVNSFEGLTDTMLLIRFNPETKKVSVLSIPRDTRSDVPGHGTTKINSANAFGGPPMAARSVSELLGGVGIDRYLTLNVQGVEALVNALGGVTVHVPKDMKYRDDSQHLYINLKEGRQRLNGNQTLQLLRFRQDEYGDIGRIQRQQMVMRALMEQSLNPATVARLPAILSVVQSHLDTNLSVEEIVALVGYATQTNRSNTQMLMLPGEFSHPGEFDASYWLPSPKRIKDVMARHFEFGQLDDVSDGGLSKLRVTIQDSTKQPTHAQSVLQGLQKAGYGNAGLGGPWNEPLSVTRIVAQQGDGKSAAAIREALGYGEIRMESTGDLESDVTIQLGKDSMRRSKK